MKLYDEYLIVNEHFDITDYQRGASITIGIAAICEAGLSPKIIFCADRLVSGQISFESGVSKLKLITLNCWVIAATNNGLKSDMIIENVKQQIPKENLTSISIKEIVELIAKECKKFETEELDRNVFSEMGIDYETYNKNIEKYSADFINIVVERMRLYNQNQYKFHADFLIFGIENFTTPHIYVVSQNGDYNCHDFVGFAIVGSGAKLAYPEMTKYIYNPIFGFPETLCRVYRAKVISQRTGTVGTTTDLAMLYVAIDPTKSNEKIYQLWSPADATEPAEILGTFIKDIDASEVNIIVDAGKKITNYLNKEIEKRKDLEKPVEPKTKEPSEKPTGKSE